LQEMYKSNKIKRIQLNWRTIDSMLILQFFLYRLIAIILSATAICLIIMWI
jgi:hypothetical protein